MGYSAPEAGDYTCGRVKGEKTSLSDDDPNKSTLRIVGPS